jgi:hypothetical protein
VVVEANAIGTAWLRAGLVRGAEGPELRRLLEEYARLRLDYMQAGPNAEREAALNRATAAAQAAIWAPAQAAALRDPTPVMAGVIASLNDTFDAALSQRYAFESRVPAHILWLLLGGSVLAVGAVGGQLGLGPQRHLVLSVLLMAMWTGGMLLIVDLNRPRQGQIRVDAAPMIWTLQGFGPPAAAKP